MKKQEMVTLIGLITVWMFASIGINHDILLPRPTQVFSVMIHQCTQFNFYQIICTTLFRMGKGLVLSVILAIFAVLIQNRYPQFKNYFAPLENIIKTVPQITYIILCLIWLGQENSVTAVIFFLLFPTFYAGLSLGLDHFHEECDELLWIYPVSEMDKSFKLALPMMIPYLINSLKLAFGLGFKVSVMAEILNQVHGGIGRQMSLAKANLDTISIFSWTIWVLIICGLINLIFNCILRKTQSKH